MLKRFSLLLLASAVCLGGVACEKKKTQAELQADKVKAFREKQKQTAAQKYQELVTKYPDSEFAAKAKERLQQLGPPTTPTPKKK